MFKHIFIGMAFGLATFAAMALWATAWTVVGQILNRALFGGL